ncbi:MAG: phosphoethanolamine transferase [Lentimicrobiaceae bacterium]|nr:phosphoethanolamine transferase [Lentimicrobiaceae bacterium]
MKTSGSAIKKVLVPLLFVFIITVAYALIFTLSEFSDSPYSNFHDFMVLAFQWVAIAVGTFGLLYLLSINKYIFAITFPLLVAFSTVLAYYRYTVNATLTPMTIELALINDLRTNMQVVSWQLVSLILLSLVVSIAIVWLRWKKISFTRPYIHLIVALGIIFMTNSFIPQLKRPLTQRMPYSIYYNFKLYFEIRDVAAEYRETFTSESVANSDSLVVVFVIGESLRNDHLQINGYERETTPYLMEEDNLVSLTDIYGAECFTHTSVPQIMTRADSANPQRAYDEQSFVTIFKDAGFRTTWIANQESVATYAYFMNECDTLIYVNGDKSVYTFDKWLDEDILPHLENELKDDNPTQLHILHSIGSHWWYNSHYTGEFERYTPVIKSRVVSSNTQEEMINSYDNTILYTDYFIKETIDLIRDKKSILIFLSDHGESLGEDGYYLHGADRPELHYPAAFVWYSDKYAQSFPDMIENLKDNSDKKYRSDYLFHSIIDAADITTEYIEPQLSIFR